MAGTGFGSAGLERSLRSLMTDGLAVQRSDAELIRSFMTSHGEAAEAAFEALIVRHGPMVLAACRRILRDEHAAEDAFQAVFLVLARRASSVRVEDSLGRWLYGVTRRVAGRARTFATREIPATADPRRVVADPVASATCAEVRQAIGQEIDRLPRKYREPVTLHYLDGLSHDQAAEAIGVPVGTIRSRLSRARDLLRTRLIRRGIAPAALVVSLSSRPSAQAAVAVSLVSMTARNANLPVSVATTTIPAAVLNLANRMVRISWMSRWIGMGFLITTVACATAGAMVLAGGGRGAKPGSSAALQPPAPSPSPTPKSPPLADRFRAIKAEYEAAERALWDEVRKAETKREQNAIYRNKSPRVTDYTRRMIDLAAEAPGDLAARSALLWVIDHPGRSDDGPYGDEFGRAASLLVRHFGDDPEAIRIGLQLDNALSFHRDALLRGFYAAAKGRESKGLARLALAQYLKLKAQPAGKGRDQAPRRTIVLHNFVDEDGKIFDKEVEMPRERFAYLLQLRECDPEYIRSEADRLFQEVIDEYGDVPYLKLRDREAEELAKQPDPKWNGKSLTAEEQDQLRKRAASRRTLGEVANAQLDDLRNLAIGKPSPDISGSDVRGGPLKLSQFRGKVVLLVFWGSWCGPCMAEVPKERELAERFKGRPFTILGVNTDRSPELARKVMDEHGITWPNWFDGDPGEGPIARLYHIRSFPSFYVLDAGGNIRSRDTIGKSLEAVVERLIAEAEKKP